jgi:hypothetical protein
MFNLLKRAKNKISNAFVNATLSLFAKTRISPQLNAFVNNKHAKVDMGFVVSLVGTVVSLIFAVYLLPVVVDAIQGTNTSGWTFTGHEGAATLYGLLPFVFVIGIMLFFIIRLITQARE